MFGFNLFVVILVNIFSGSVFAWERVSTRIIGGKEVSIGQYPYTLQLWVNNNHVCGAALLNEDTAITASHCFQEEGSYFVKAGSYHVQSAGEVAFIKTAIKHPNYDGTTNDNDICVLKLSRNISYSVNIQPVKLPSQDEPIKEGLLATVTGWGVMDVESGTPSLHIRALQVPIMPMDSCQKDYSNSKGTMITRNMFCAGFSHGGQDACQGDSGGPLVANGILYGIVSWGIGCAGPGQPGVYTTVSRYVDFINKNV